VSSTCKWSSWLGTVRNKLNDRSNTLARGKFEPHQRMRVLRCMTYVSFCNFSSAPSTCWIWLSYRSNSSRRVSWWNISGSKWETEFCRRQSFWRWPAKRGRCKLARDPIRQCTNSSSYVMIESGKETQIVSINSHSVVKTYTGVSSGNSERKSPSSTSALSPPWPSASSSSESTPSVSSSWISGGIARAVVKSDLRLSL